MLKNSPDIVLVEVPPESWAIGEGIPARKVDLSFDIKV